MAQQSKTVATATTNETKGKATEKEFSIASLRGNCAKLFGITSSTFDGAFFNADNRKYSISEAKELISKWQGKEIGK